MPGDVVDCFGHLIGQVNPTEYGSFWAVRYARKA